MHDASKVHCGYPLQGKLTFVASAMRCSGLLRDSARNEKGICVLQQNFLGSGGVPGGLHHSQLLKSLRPDNPTNNNSHPGGSSQPPIKVGCATCRGDNEGLRPSGAERKMTNLYGNDASLLRCRSRASGAPSTCRSPGRSTTTSRSNKPKLVARRALVVTAARILSDRPATSRSQAPTCTGPKRTCHQDCILTPFPGVPSKRRPVWDSRPCRCSTTRDCRSLVCIEVLVVPFPSKCTHHGVQARHWLHTDCNANSLENAN